MDKETLSQYGWVIICIIVLVILITSASPFGTYIGNSAIDVGEIVVDGVKENLGVDTSEGDIIDVPDANGKIMTQIYVANNMAYEKNNLPKTALTSNPGTSNFPLTITLKDGTTQNVTMIFSSGQWGYEGTIDGAKIRIQVKPDQEFSYLEGVISSTENNLITVAAIKDAEDYDGLASISALGATIEFANIPTYGWMASEPITADSSKITRFIYTFEDGTQTVYKPNFISGIGEEEGCGHGFTNTGDEEFSTDANITPIENYTYFFVANDSAIMGFINGSLKDISLITIEQEIDGELEMATYEVVPE